MAGLVPAILIVGHCALHRDRRDKPGDDVFGWLDFICRSKRSQRRLGQFRQKWGRTRVPYFGRCVFPAIDSTARRTILTGNQRTTAVVLQKQSRRFQ
jgi:hypothetical protein